MTILLRCVACTLFTFILHTANAQKGLPPNKKATNRQVTNYAQHLDFDPAMVNMLNVPDGWKVSIAAYGLGKPRMMHIGPNGELYITRRDAGDVLMLKDKDHDNVFEELVTVAADFKGVHGIASKDGWMYLCNNNQLRRYRMNSDGTLTSMELLISNLPNGGQHPNRTIGFGPDGMLYISVGSDCNDCSESDKELATMLQVNPADWTRTIYASGLRNTIGFGWHPQTGELWGMDNGGDYKGNKWPPEELNKIIKGSAYGWPLAYGKREVDQTREDPPGATKEEWVKKTEPSVMELPAHMAPIGFAFFGNAANVPADYSGDGLVCWHGSWNRNKPKGFKVQRIHFENGVPVSATDFLTGFLRKKKARFGRPAGVIVSTAGTVFISDDANGVVYAISRK